ncbi:MAG: hypothetical protein V4581_16780 [Bacteroidota bacterium]
MLDQYLPAHYADEAVKRLAKKGLNLTASIVRNARSGRPAKNKTAVVSVLIEMATEEKQAIDAISKQLN